MSLGSTDGSFTQVVAGDIAAGAKVVVGLLPKEERNRSIGPLRL